jgi:hypothetical protein
MTAALADHQPAEAGNHTAMDRLGYVVVFSVMAGSAVLVAFLLGYVAHYDMGLARLEIRHSASIAAAVIAMLLPWSTTLSGAKDPVAR